MEKTEVNKHNTRRKSRNRGIELRSSIKLKTVHDSQDNYQIGNRSARGTETSEHAF